MFCVNDIINIVIAALVAATYVVDHCPGMGCLGLAPFLSGPKIPTISATPTTITAWMTTTITTTLPAPMSSSTTNSSGFAAQEYDMYGLVVWEDLEPVEAVVPSFYDSLLGFLRSFNPLIIVFVALAAGALVAPGRRTRQVLSLSTINCIKTAPIAAARAALSYSSINGMGIAPIAPAPFGLSFSSINRIVTTPIASAPVALSLSSIYTINTVPVAVAPARLIAPKPAATKSMVAKKAANTLISLQEERDNAIATARQHATEIAALRKERAENDFARKLDITKDCMKALQEKLAAAEEAKEEAEDEMEEMEAKLEEMEEELKKMKEEGDKKEVFKFAAAAAANQKAGMKGVFNFAMPTPATK